MRTIKLWLYTAASPVEELQWRFGTDDYTAAARHVEGDRYHVEFTNGETTDEVEVIATRRPGRSEHNTSSVESSPRAPLLPLKNP